MLEFLRTRNSPCQMLRATLEGLDDERSLLPALAQHVEVCADCRAAIAVFTQSRALLAPLRGDRAQVQPWFASRVMAAIAEQESKLERSLEAWSAVPRLASKIAWVSALALLLSSTWLIEQRSMPKKTVTTDLAGEPVIDSHPTPANNDEVLFNLTERME